MVLGFAFYLQPMMMPLLHDMPPGPTGLAITSTAVKIVIIGTLPWPHKVMSCVVPGSMFLHCTSGKFVCVVAWLLADPFINQNSGVGTENACIANFL